MLIGPQEIGNFVIHDIFGIMGHPNHWLVGIFHIVVIKIKILIIVYNFVSKHNTSSFLVTRSFIS